MKIRILTVLVWAVAGWAIAADEAAKPTAEVGKTTDSQAAEKSSDDAGKDGKDAKGASKEKGSGTTSAADAARELEQQVAKVAEKLSSNQATEREAAEKQLLELAGTMGLQADKVIAALPKDSEQLPLAMRDRLARIRRQIEDRVAKNSTVPSTVTLSAKSMPIAEVFRAIETQTGNKITDAREEPDDKDAAPATITIELKDEPFWSAMDQILDQAKLGVNNLSGTEALSIVARGQADGPRHGKATYEGPLRIEALQVQAQRGLRRADQQVLELLLEVGWEPRMRPIAVSQPADELKVETEGGQPLQVRQQNGNLDIEPAAGSQAEELTLPLTLPGRDVKKISKLHGKLHALVPGRHAKFEFPDVVKAVGKTQTISGVRVGIDDVRKNGAVWEVHMRFSLDSSGGLLESHRDWVFQNLSYMTAKDGSRIENAGFETTRQSDKEIGIAYLFDTEEGLDGLTWVYESPAAIVELPIDYELKDIELP